MNSVTVNSVEIPVREDEVKRGPEKGTKFLTIDFTDVKSLIEKLKNAYGEEKIFKSLVFPKLRQMCSSYSSEARDDATGVIDEEQYVGFLQTLSARGETLAEIDAQLMETIAAMLSCGDDHDKLMELAQRANSLRQAKESKRRKSPEEVAESSVPTA